LTKRGVAAESCDQVDDIRALVAREARAGDVVVLMSNGDFGGLAEKLLTALELDRVP
jgi:UDP-N-acetylmuramate: L-alanyl-gamma-D-glutamyl-meso-diaminopimelate ligase